MTSKELKIMAGGIIKESEYSKSAKKQLFNFVLNEASEEQLKALILDGKIVKNLAEDAINIINDRFDITLEKANMERVEDIKEFAQFGKKFLCKVMESDCEDKDMLKNIVEFINKEASDYQVLSMIFESSLPEDLTNSEKEPYLYEKLLKIRDKYKK